MKTVKLKVHYMPANPANPTSDDPLTTANQKRNDPIEEWKTLYIPPNRVYN